MARTGEDFERAIAAAYELMGGEADVEHDVRLSDKHGNTRQFDVVLRSKMVGHELLGVIECKDLNRKVGTPEVEAFLTKADLTGKTGDRGSQL